MKNSLRDNIIYIFTLLPLYLSPIIIINIVGNYVGSELMHRKSILILDLFIIYLLIVASNKFIFKKKIINIIILLYILAVSVVIINFGRFYILYLKASGEQYSCSNLVFYVINNSKNNRILYRETQNLHGCGIIINSNAYIDSALLGKNASINEIGNLVDNNNVKFVDQYKIIFYNSDELCIKIYYDSSGVNIYSCDKQQNINCNHIGFLKNNKFVIDNLDEFNRNAVCINTAVNNIFHNILTIK